jgi:hypothetical protein
MWRTGGALIGSGCHFVLINLFFAFVDKRFLTGRIIRLFAPENKNPNLQTIDE